MAAAWVESALAVHIRPDPNGARLRLDDTQDVTVDTFCSIFGQSVETALGAGGDLYTALCGPQTFVWEGAPVTADAAELGYLGFFDAWRAGGLI